jgi:hypothetical protein
MKKTKAKLPRRKFITTVPRHGFDAAATAACLRILDDAAVPIPIKDQTAILLSRSVRRQR